jgi:hypothetical protein
MVLAFSLSLHLTREWRTQRRKIQCKSKLASSKSSFKAARSSCDLHSESDLQSESGDEHGFASESENKANPRHSNVLPGQVAAAYQEKSRCAVKLPLSH